MKMITAEYAASAVREDQYPKDKQPEIALAGRSNVGKSSLINTLVARKNLARTSSEPGKTQTLNFYHINDEFYLVDVPGYGYAKVSKTKREAFGEMIQDYLETRPNLKGLIILVDARREPTSDDLSMFQYASFIELPILVVATKMDKLKRQQMVKTEALLKQTFQSDQAPVTFLSFSSVTKQHLAELNQWLETQLTH